jgi:hypothetical protein
MMAGFSMSGVSENPAIMMDRGIFDVWSVRKSRHHHGPRDFRCQGCPKIPPS